MKKALVCIGLAALMILPLQAGTEGRWLHVRVEEGRSDPELVSINVPLELVEALLPTIETDELRKGRIQLMEAADLEGVDLRAALEALRDAPDGEYVKVKSRDETVLVSKETGYLMIKVDEDRGDRIRVRLPMEIIDAMISEDHDELDLVAGLRALADYDSGDLVLVDSDHSTVRVWIDSNQAGD